MYGRNADYIFFNEPLDLAMHRNWHRDNCELRHDDNFTAPSADG
jgi:hypothetical protein